MDEDPNSIMADTLIAGTTLIEKESRSIGDVPIGSIINWYETFSGTPNLPEGFLKCDGSVIVDALSPLEGQTLPNLPGDEYLSVPGIAFHSQRTDIDDVIYGSANGKFETTGANITALAPVSLPDGAVVSSVIVYSDSSTEAWTLESNPTDGSSDEIIHATATLNTADTTITTPTIDSQTRQYFLTTAAMDAGDNIFGAKIIYKISPVTEIKVMRIR